MVSKETIITAAMLVLITYTLSLSLVSQAYPAGQASKTLSSSGSIQIQTSTGIEVYQDYSCTTNLTSISWGTLEPGESQERIIYIKNVGDNPVILSLQSSGWNPSYATNYLTLSWNYLNQEISPDDSIQIRLILDVDSSISGIETFGFNIIITAQ